GPITIALGWSTSERRAAPAWIELGADARRSPVWTMERQPGPIPNGTVLGQHVFLVTGDVPIDVATLDQVVARADILSIVVRRNVVVRIARSTPDAAILE